MYRIVINQSLQQLQELRHTIEDIIVLGTHRSQEVEEIKEIQKEGVRRDMRQLKLVLSINLQRILVNLNCPNKHTISDVQQAYSIIVDMEEEIEDIMEIDEKTLNYKLIQTILDFSISEKYGLQRIFYFEEFLPFIEQKEYLKQFHNKNNQQYVLLFIGLIFQLIKKKDFQSYLQIYAYIVKYEKQKIERLKKQYKCQSNKEIIKQLVILLNLHLSYKLLKKHFKLAQSPFDDQQLYLLLYELEQAIHERSTIQYKKLYNKAQNEAIDFVLQRLKTFFIDLQSTILNRTPLYIKPNSKPKQFKVRKSSSKQSMNSAQKQRSLKVREQRLKIRNNMYICQKVNTNKQLQHRRQFRMQKNKLQINKNTKLAITSIKKVEDIAANQIQTNSKQSIDSYNRQSFSQDTLKLSYSHLIKGIVGVNQQLQLMLCQRPTDHGKRLSFESKQSLNREQSSKKTSILQRRKRNNSKLIIRNLSNLKQVQQKMVSNHSLSEPNQLYIPPLIKRILYNYLLSYAHFALYHNKRQSVPFYAQFSKLDKNKYYYFYGSIYQFSSIKQENLVFHFKFRVISLDEERAGRINLLDVAKKQSIKQLLKIRRQRLPSLSEFFYFGKQIMLFTLNLRLGANDQQFMKHDVVNIRYENQIYAYNIYFNTIRINNKLIKKAIQKQELLMRKINHEAQIYFDYNQSINYQQSNPPNYSTNLHIRFHEFYHPISLQYDHYCILVQSLSQPLKINKSFHLFQFKLYRQRDKQHYYLVLTNHKYHRFVLPCRKISIKSVLKSIRSLSQLKSIVMKRKLLLCQSWNHVILNQAILQPPLKKYCLRNDNQYRIYYSKTIIEGRIKMVYGSNNQRRWFILIPLQAQPICVKKRPSNNMKIRSVRGYHRQLKDEQGVQFLFNERMRKIRVYKNQLQYCYQLLKMIRYQYSWIYYQKGKTHYCFKDNSNIIDYSVYQQHLLYVNHITLSSQSTKQDIFQTYKQSIHQKYSHFKKVIFQFGQILNIQQKGDTYQCSFLYNTIYSILIDQSQLTFFNGQNFKMKSSLLQKKSFKRRLMHIIEGKVEQHNYHTY